MLLGHGQAVRLIHDAMDQLIAFRYLREYRLFLPPDSDAVRLECSLRSGQLRQYRLTGMEIANGDRDGIEFWLRTVERDIRARHDEAALQGLWNSAAGTGILSQHQFQQQFGQSQNLDAMLAQQQALYNQYWRQTQANFHAQLGEFNSQFYQSPIDSKANEKAEELFVLACGKKAFDTLKSGKPLPITGSKGTKYTLHKRAAYCVERVSDNARLCAVVPSVPLWDHLLGIKLMIEHDEPKFLSTANVAYAGLSIPPHYHQMLSQNVMANNSLLQRIRNGIMGVTGDVST